MMAGIYARLSRRGRTAVLIGGIGYAWSFALVFRPACSAMIKPSAEDQQPYAPPGDSSHGDLKTMLRRVKDWPASRDDSNGSVGVAWRSGKTQRHWFEVVVPATDPPSPIG